MQQLRLIFILTIFLFAASKKGFFTQLSSKTAVNEVKSSKTDSFSLLGSLFRNFDYSRKEIIKALQSIAANQGTLRSIDGLTQHLKKSLGDSTSLFQRLKTFLLTKKRSLKEASKILEYIQLVERSLQSCEVLHATSLTDDASRQRAINHTKLVEIFKARLTHGKYSWSVSLLTPLQYEVDQQEDSDYLQFTNNELVIAIGDLQYFRKKSTNSENDAFYNSALETMRLSASPNCIQYLLMRSAGLVNEEVAIHRTVLFMAIKTMQSISPFLHAKVNVTEYVSTDPVDVTNCNVTTTSNNLKLNKENKTLQTGIYETNKYQNIRIVGYSVGGSIGSIMSMILDGSLNVTLPAYIQKALVKRNDNGTSQTWRMSKKTTVAQSRAPLNQDSAVRDDDPSDLTSSAPATTDTSTQSSQQSFDLASSKPFSLDRFIGLYPSRVRCLCISPLPCISRVIVPQFISSVICGDDMVPRATPESIGKLRARLAEALKSGAGKGSFGWSLGGAWLGDMQRLAQSSMQQYASGSHDVNSLSVPGRVFYIRARKINKGASLQRVFRGNWREDMLWLLHEIVVSDRVLKHHELLYCAQVLARV